MLAFFKKAQISISETKIKNYFLSFKISFFNEGTNWSVLIKKGMNESSSILRLGYVRENFPYIANCSLFNKILRKCKNAGIMSEAWLQFADYYGYTIQITQYPFYGGYNDSTNQYYGILGGMINGTVDATLSLITPNNYRIRSINLGPVMTTYKLGFIYGEMSVDQGIAINVFDWWSISLIFIFLVLLFIIFLIKGQSLNYSIKRLHEFIEIQKMPRNPILILGYYQIYLLYSAAFRSQTISSSVSQQPFKNIIQLNQRLKQKSIEILIADASMIANAQQMYLDPSTYKSNPAKIISNYEDIVTQLCHNRKTVYYGNIAQMSGIWYAKPSCLIRTLDKIGNESIETFLTIGYRKTLPKKTRERIDEFFHLLFSVDAFNRHWARIYQSYYTENNAVLTFSPIKLIALIDAVYLYFIGIGLAIILLASEIGVHITAVYYWSKILDKIEIHKWHFIKKYGAFSWKN